MKLTLVIITLFFSLTFSLSAQNMLNGMMDNYRFTKMTDGTYTHNNLKISDIQGTPYLDGEFSPGKITTKDGTVYTEIPLRYNAYSDELEFQKDKDAYNIEPKTLIIRAEFGGAIFSCKEYDMLGKIQNGLFEVLSEGKAILLMKYSIRLLEPEAAKAYGDPKPPRFDDVQKAYFITINGSPAKLIASKKTLIELFGDKKGEMESYISKNKLSVKSDVALIKIVAHYNSL